MRLFPGVIREHAPFLIIVTALTLATTWPTLKYALQPDVFWLPTGKSSDVYIHLWDVWYGKKFLTGQAYRYYTNLMFYPEGVSLTHHQFAIPYQILVNALIWAGGGIKCILSCVFANHLVVGVFGLSVSCL